MILECLLLVHFAQSQATLIISGKRLEALTVGSATIYKVDFTKELNRIGAIDHGGDFGFVRWVIADQCWKRGT